LYGLVCAFVISLLSATNVNAALITRATDFRIISYFDDNGHECSTTCGNGFLEWEYDPSDLLHSFQYSLYAEGGDLNGWTAAGSVDTHLS
jgi:hypothetical protein